MYYIMSKNFENFTPISTSSNSSNSNEEEKKDGIITNI